MGSGFVDFFVLKRLAVFPDLMDLFTSVLTPDDIVKIDEAGAKGLKQNFASVFLRRLALIALAGGAALGVCGYLGIDLI